MRRLLALAVFVSCLAGCGGSSHSAPAHRSAAAGSWAPPVSVAGRLMGARTGVVNLPRGTLVRSQEIGMRIFVDARRGFALARVPNGELYPAETLDGGRNWRIDGPVFYVPAAQGPSVVAWVGAEPPLTYFAYGLGSVVNVTTDGGKHWRASFLGDDVLSVVPGTKPNHLIAVVQDFGSGGGTSNTVQVTYLSKDGGRRWRKANGFVY
jgi:hypothetical protein